MYVNILGITKTFTSVAVVPTLKLSFLVTENSREGRTGKLDLELRGTQLLNYMQQENYSAVESS